MSLFRNVISKLGTQVQQTAETVGQTVGQTVGKRVSQSLDAALSSGIGHAVSEAWQKTLAGVTPGLPESLPAWSAKEFEKQIRNRLKPGVSQHPFFRKLQAGSLNQTQLQVWLANEWYCQQNLPLKDAAILSNCEDAAFRRIWTRRLLEQDGGDSGMGAVDHWARIAQGLGLESSTLHDMTLVTPGVRFAMDTYVNFARRAPWTEAVCASLSELQSNDGMRQLLETLERHYGKPDGAAAAFFNERGAAHRRDWDAAMKAVNDYFKTREDQEYALDILQFKHDILWTCLDSISLSPLAQETGESDAETPRVKGEPPLRSRRRKAAAGETDTSRGRAGKTGGKPGSTTKGRKADAGNAGASEAATSAVDAEQNRPDTPAGSADQGA